MKKSFFFMSLLLGLFVSAFILMACSSDDDAESGNPPSKQLVGDWKVVGGDEWVRIGEVISFYEDGTCNWSLYTAWNISDGKLYLTKDSGKVEEYLFEFKNGQLHLTYPDGKATECTICEKTDLSAIKIEPSYFVGTWTTANGSAYVTLKFSSDGRFDYIYAGVSKSGTWQYDSVTRILETTISNMSWEIVSAIENEWIARDGQTWQRK